MKENCKRCFWFNRDKKTCNFDEKICDFFDMEEEEFEFEINGDKYFVSQHYYADISSYYPLCQMAISKNGELFVIQSCREKKITLEEAQQFVKRLEGLSNESR